MHKKSIIHLFLVIQILAVFISCASVSPISSDREKTALFSSVENIEPQWQQFADGVDYFHGKLISPKIKFWALRIDLSSPNVEIVVKGGANKVGNEANSESTFSTRVSSFVRENDLDAGINATPFDVVSSKEMQPIKNIGIVVSDGKLISTVNNHYDALVFFKDGNISIVRQASITSIENIENAIGGFYQILKEGQLTERAQNSEPRHPRSAAGISADTQYLYLLVIDGRQAASIGATEGETALLLSALGSHNGINFDGGGSSALVLLFHNGKVKLVNTPIHRVIPGQERAVAGCLGIRLKNNQQP